ncbi:carboxymuconolactone decarboxylase family protein [Pedobacter sp.]|uniref:carboxymuconolactone decarboxylase family protein n=1 Tax=Pedobacter sp. TaxID=1411316 RepID=UPI003BACCC45
MNAQIETGTSTSLSQAQQSLVAISSLTATGDMTNLKIQLNTALGAGLTVNEIKEVLVQLYAYCGFPRSLNAINVFMKVIDERKSKGISDNEGKKIIINRASGDNYERGRKVLETLTGTSQAKPAPGFGEFIPSIDAFLKEHLFADVFQSDVLTYQQRELVTISALAAMQGVESQLQSHVKMGMNTGITQTQLIEVAKQIEKHVSRTQANSLRNVLSIDTTAIVQEDMMVRISEIEIIPEYLEQYNAILKEEASASVKLEQGVIAIFPMFQKETPTQIRIIEIYANKAAYQSHLTTPHFQHYKTSTLKMVKALKLVDMVSLDKQTMQEIFKKLK